MVYVESLMVEFVALGMTITVSEWAGKVIELFMDVFCAFAETRLGFSGEL